MISTKKKMHFLLGLGRVPSVQHRIVPVLSFIFSTLCCSTNVYFEAYFKKIIEYNIHNAGVIVCVVQNVSVQKKYHCFISTIFVSQTNKACIPTPQLTAILLKYHTQIIQQFKLDRLVRQSKETDYYIQYYELVMFVAVIIGIQISLSLTMIVVYSIVRVYPYSGT